MINRAIPEAKWKQFKGQVKERWGRLTDNDITVINGEIDQLVGKIQERYGSKREDVEKDVRDWYQKHLVAEKSRSR